MKTYSKSLLIAVAALAVTATGAYAYTGDLTEEQRTALTEARELRQAGDFTAARDKLLEAGFDESTLKKLRHGRVHHQRHVEFMNELQDTLTDEQLDALRVARAANDHETAAAILEEVGITPPQWRGHAHGHRPDHDLEGDEEETEFEEEED